MLYLIGATALLWSALAWLSWVDARTYRLPDLGTLPLLAVGLLVNLVLTETPVLALAGALIGYGLFWAVETGFRYLRGVDGLGRGDAKLLAAGGAWCGAGFLPVIMLIGAGSGLLFVILLAAIRRQTLHGRIRIAFGPWLALGIALSWWARVFADADLVFG